MVNSVTFTSDPTGAVAPAAAAPVAPPEQALAAAQAELTRVQQELLALKTAAGAVPATPDTPLAPPDAPPADSTAAAREEAAKAAVAASGFDMSAFQQEFTDTGDVSAEGRDKIAEGLKSLFGDRARQMVDDYVDGQRDRLTRQTSELFTAGGGEEGYKTMAAWAREALSPEEVRQFDRVVSSGDHDAALFAIRGLRSRYEAVQGREPNLIGGSAAPTARGFASRAEMTTAMSDPRYKSDPAYRRTVEQKVIQSAF